MQFVGQQLWTCGQTFPFGMGWNKKQYLPVHYPPMQVLQEPIPNQLKPILIFLWDEN